MDVTAISWEALSSVFILGSFGTALAFVVYYEILSGASASYVSLVTYLMPIYGVALGISFLDEYLYWEAIVGAVLIILGIMVANKTLSLPFKKRALKVQ